MKKLTIRPTCCLGYNKNDIKPFMYNYETSFNRVRDLLEHLIQVEYGLQVIIEVMKSHPTRRDCQDHYYITLLEDRGGTKTLPPIIRDALQSTKNNGIYKCLVDIALETRMAIEGLPSKV